LLEGLAGQVVQVGRFGRREQGPGALFHHALHEQVRDPVGQVQVVRATRFVAGVVTQLEEILDVGMPAFQVHTGRALALAALVDRSDRRIHRFQPRHDAVGMAVGRLDQRAA
jgi:predicted YcjX-like family ATPase